MRVPQRVLPLMLALTGLGGCNVYERWEGEEFNAGPVDAQTFPPEYLGTGANRQRAGTGSFTARRMFTGGAQSEYFLFSFTAAQRSAGADGLAVRRNGAATSAAPTPSAYVFDPDAERPNCQAPGDYTFDPVRDEVDYSTQGVIFSRLPTATYNPGADPTWTYVPIVSRVPVTSKGEPCQAIKSETLLVKRQDVELPLSAPVNGKQVGVSDGSFLAYAVIEPGAGVYHYTASGARDPATGVGMQKWGWYNQYLLAYLDGGPVPTQEVTVSGAAQVRMVTQRLYYPRSQVIVGTAAPRAVTVGGGFDIITARRGSAGSSPVCEVLTYDAGGARTVDQLPKSAAEVETLYAATLQPPVPAVGTRSPVGDPYVYCLQLP